LNETLERPLSLPSQRAFGPGNPLYADSAFAAAAQKRCVLLLLLLLLLLRSAACKLHLCRVH
jgi:hypothetical protein